MGTVNAHCYNCNKYYYSKQSVGSNLVIICPKCAQDITCSACKVNGRYTDSQFCGKKQCRMCYIDNCRFMTVKGFNFYIHHNPDYRIPVRESKSLYSSKSKSHSEYIPCIMCKSKSLEGKIHCGLLHCKVSSLCVTCHVNPRGMIGQKSLDCCSPSCKHIYIYKKENPCPTSGCNNTLKWNYEYHEPHLMCSNYWNNRCISSSGKSKIQL